MLYAIRRWGWREVLRQIYHHHWFRGGDLVGVDAAGNRYYQVTDSRYFQHGKDRYVEYGEVGRDNWRGDGSMIPPHWHGWLHHTHEEVPREEEVVGRMDTYKENMTGTGFRYVAGPSPACNTNKQIEADLNSNLKQLPETPDNKKNNHK